MSKLVDDNNNNKNKAKYHFYNNLNIKNYINIDQQLKQR